MKSPLMRFVRKKSRESIIFSLILTLFISGLILNGLEYRGLVTGTETSALVVVNEQCTENTSIAIPVNGNVTSIRITGMFIGNGTGRIYVDGQLIVDSTKLESSGNLITGMVAGGYQAVEVLTNNTFADENITVSNESQEIVSVNENINATEEFNQSSVNETNVSEEIQNEELTTENDGLKNQLSGHESKIKQLVQDRTTLFINKL